MTGDPGRAAIGAHFWLVTNVMTVTATMIPVVAMTNVTAGVI